MMNLAESKTPSWNKNLLSETIAAFLPYHSLIEDQAQNVPTDVKLRVGWLLQMRN